MNNTLVVYGLLLLEGVNRKTVFKLYNRLNSFQNIELVTIELKRIMGAKGRNIDYNTIKVNLIKAERLIEKTIENDIKVISIFDNSYPKRFLLINDPPVLLFVKGNIDHFNKGVNIAIIGTREPTEHGTRVAARLGKNFSEKQCNVVSGLAIGCDTFAHKGCLYSNGKTLAVMPGGLDKIVPSSNKILAQDILKSGGALISEYALGVRPYRGNYVDRNRLQSAFSEIVLIVETDVKGGTMHTAHFSKEQNKILVCYNHPEKYYNESKVQGNRKLINDGEAISLSSEQDIVNLIETAKEKKKEIDSSVELFMNKRKIKIESCKSNVGEVQMDLFRN